MCLWLAYGGVIFTGKCLDSHGDVRPTSKFVQNNVLKPILMGYELVIRTEYDLCWTDEVRLFFLGGMKNKVQNTDGVAREA